MITIAGNIQLSQLPSAASRFVHSAMVFSVVESWDEPKDNGSHSDGYDVMIENAPVRVSTTFTIFPADEATTIIVDVNLKVAVPLVNETIEKRVMGTVGRVMAGEEHRAVAWLAEH